MKGVGIPAPAKILQGLSVDRKLASVLSAAPLRRDQPGGADSAAHYSIACGGGILIDIVRVVCGAGIHINGAGILPPDSDHGLPSHGGSQIHLVGQGFFACAGITDIDDHVKIDVALPSVGLKIEEVGSEVEFSVATGGRVAPVAEGKGHQIP